MDKTTSNLNTLEESIRDIQEKDRYNVILANPPFGGKEGAEVQQNFDIKTGETAFLFMQHFIKSLKTGGRAAIVIKNTLLSNTDNASVALRKLLLESCNLHTILDMPGGTFTGAGVKTVVLIFQTGEPTKNVWFYQLNAGRNMGKTNPLDGSVVSTITNAPSLNSKKASNSRVSANFLTLKKKASSIVLKARKRSAPALRNSRRSTKSSSTAPARWALSEQAPTLTSA